MVGWQDLTAQVAEIYQSIPETEKPRTVILAGNYGEAGALDLYGDEYGLPRVISGANSLWYRGYGEPEPETVIVVGFERGYAENFFSSCEYAGTVTNSYSVKNEETKYHTGLYICREPRDPGARCGRKWPCAHGSCRKRFNPRLFNLSTRTVQNSPNDRGSFTLKLI